MGKNLLLSVVLLFAIVLLKGNNESLISHLKDDPEARKFLQRCERAIDTMATENVASAANGMRIMYCREDILIRDANGRIRDMLFTYNLLEPLSDLTAAEFSNDGGLLVTGHRSQGCYAAKLIIWNLKNKQPQTIVELGWDKEPRVLAFSSDDTMIMVGSSGKRLDVIGKMGNYLAGFSFKDACAKFFDSQRLKRKKHERDNYWASLEKRTRAD